MSTGNSKPKLEYYQLLDKKVKLNYGKLIEEMNRAKTETESTEDDTHINKDYINPYKSLLQISHDEKSNIKPSKSPLTLKSFYVPSEEITTNTLKSPIDLTDESEECFTVRFNESSTHIASGYSSGKITISPLTPPDESLKKTITSLISEFPITCLRWKPKNRTTLMASTADGLIAQIHSTSGKILHKIIEKNNPIMCVDYSNDGYNFVSAGNDKVVKLYDDNTKVLLSELRTKKFDCPSHDNRIFSVKFNPDDCNMVVSGGWDNTLLIYDVRQRETNCFLYGPHICGDSIDIKENVLLTCSWDIKDQIQIWDIRMLKKIKDIQCFIGEELKDSNNINFSYLYACRFNPKKNMFCVGGSNRNLIRTYGYDQGNYGGDSRIIFECDKMDFPVYTVDFSSNGKFMAYGASDSMTRVVEID